jgi:23S rRNA (adenine2030-N6)-methyltransferase
VNYRHAFHAGNFADVLKHALLVRLLRAMQRKERGFAFVDTHAGRGGYDLSRASEGDSRERVPEWPDGIGRLWDRADAPAEVADYVGLIRDFDRGRGNLAPAPRFYPGSPRIARILSRPQDRMELWERHPSEFASLRDEFGGERRVSLHEEDGYGAVRACLPPAERRALVLIDPPFESPSEWADVSASLAEGLARLPAGTFAVWYPLTERARAEGFVRLLESVRVPTLAVDLVVDPDAPRMKGCGVIVANPPWKFEGEARGIVDYLARVLCRGQEAQGSVRWVVPE